MAGPGKGGDLVRSVFGDAANVAELNATLIAIEIGFDEMKTGQRR